MKRGASILLVLALCFTTVSSVYADDLKDAKGQLNNMQDSINDKKQKLDDVNDKQEDVKKNLDKLDQRMNQSQENLDSLNDKVSILNSKISDYESRIKESFKNLQNEDELFKKRIRAMYINGSEGYLEILLESGSFSDFLSRIDTLTRVAEYDKNLIMSIENNRKKLETEKANLEKSKKQAIALKEEVSSKYVELQSTSNEKKNLMLSLEGDKAAYEKAIELEERQSKVITSMIANIKKQQKASKEAPKKEAQKEKSPQQSKTSSTDSASNSNSSSKPSSNSSSSGSSKTTPGSSTTATSSSGIGGLHCVTGKHYTITSAYGWRVHPVTGTKKFHAGIDIGVNSGTTIYALTDGKVIYSGWMSGYGNVVMIDHGNIISLYGHNSSLLVSVGQEVKGGQPITKSGSTGISTGPHLHFEIRNPSGQTTSPMPYYVG